MAVEIEWIDSISPAATGNKIYRDTVPSTGEVEIADIANGVQFHSDDTVAVGTSYKYEVQAHDGAGDETTQEVEGENMDYITTSNLGPELITNGGFDTDTDWTKYVGTLIEDGVAKISAGAYENLLSQDFVANELETFEISFDIVTFTSGTGVYCSVGGTANDFAGPFTAEITHTMQLTRNTGANSSILFQTAGGSGTILNIDNVSVKKIF